MLQEVWACWCELLSYIEQENAFLDQLEEKLDKTENLPGGSDELQKVLDVSVNAYIQLMCKAGKAPGVALPRYINNAVLLHSLHI